MWSNPAALKSKSIYETHFACIGSLTSKHKNLLILVFSYPVTIDFTQHRGASMRGVVFRGK